MDEMTGTGSEVASNPPAASIFRETGDVLELAVNVGLYTEEVVFRVCYWFTDRCYVFVDRLDEDHLVVRLSRRDGSVPLRTLAGEFANELLNQRVRDGVGRETAKVRELIVSQAFAEADFKTGSSDSGPRSGS